MTSTSTDTSVVVIGGGQAGLSVSFYLKRLGLDPGNEFVVLDRGPSTGGAWQFRWDALRIGSAHRINDLPGLDELGVSFETADRHAPAKTVVADYYARYEEHFGFQVVRPASVTRVENHGANLRVTFNDGQGDQHVTTDIVINATGTWGSPFIPWYPGLKSFEGRHVHTTEYREAAEFAGQKVVVVGGGTSAIGFLLELENIAESLTWVSRRPIEFLEDGELNLEARVSAVAMQDEAARAGRALPSIVSGTGVPRTRRIQAGIDRGLLNARPMFSSIEPNGVRWADGEFAEADVIIWSTGFRPELRHLAPLKLREKEGGIVVANGTAWKDGRIFFAGYGPQASTIGANRAGRTIARQAVATLSRLGREEREERDEADRIAALQAAVVVADTTPTDAPADDPVAWVLAPPVGEPEQTEAPEHPALSLDVIDAPLAEEAIDFFGDNVAEEPAEQVEFSADDFFGDNAELDVFEEGEVVEAPFVIEPLDREPSDGDDQQPDAREPFDLGVFDAGLFDGDDDDDLGPDVEREFTIARVIDAPRERVFDAWTQPEQLGWFSSGLGESDDPIEVDLEVGGWWTQKMVVSDDTAYVTGGVYREIIPGEKLVFTWGAKNGWPEISDEHPEDSPVATVMLDESGDQTEMLFHLQLPGHLPDERVREWLESGIREGWTQTLDRLVVAFR